MVKYRLIYQQHAHLSDNKLNICGVSAPCNLGSVQCNIRTPGFLQHAVRRVLVEYSEARRKRIHVRSVTTFYMRTQYK